MDNKKLISYQLALLEQLKNELICLIDEIKADRNCSEEKAQEYLVQGLIAAKTREEIFSAYIEA